MNRRRPWGRPGRLAETFSSPAAAGAPRQARRGSDADPLTVGRASEAAPNPDQLETAAAMFAAGAEFEVVGPGTWQGRAALQAFQEAGWGIQPQVALSVCRCVPREGWGPAHETSQWLKAPGLGALDYSAAISTFIKARQIRRIAATVARQSAADLQALLAGFVP